VRFLAARKSSQNCGSKPEYNTVVAEIKVKRIEELKEQITPEAEEEIVTA
jgi:hypothetical protein